MWHVATPCMHSDGAPAHAWERVRCVCVFGGATPRHARGGGASRRARVVAHVPEASEAEGCDGGAASCAEMQSNVAVERCSRARACCGHLHSARVLCSPPHDVVDRPCCVWCTPEGSGPVDRCTGADAPCLQSLLKLCVARSSLICQSLGVSAHGLASELECDTCQSCMSIVWLSRLPDLGRVAYCDSVALGTCLCVGFDCRVQVSVLLECAGVGAERDRSYRSV